MSKFSKGDIVVAKRDIGGFFRESVPKGTKGVVLEGGWLDRPTVLFKVNHFWSGEEAIEMIVDDDDIH